MVKKVTLSVPDELFKEMQKWRKALNFSRIFQEAVSNEVQKKELFKTKLREQDKTMKEIFENGGFETSQEQYTKGKELGFVYAKTAPYPEIKAYEEYIEGWDSKDSAQVKQFHDDLNRIFHLERKGVWKLEESRASSEKWPKNAIPLTHSFDYGFMEGIMDFLKQECTNVEVDKLIMERDKEMALVIDEGKKHRILMFYTKEIDSKIKGK